jgi:hypothetical protein
VDDGYKAGTTPLSLEHNSSSDVTAQVTGDNHRNTIAICTGLRWLAFGKPAAISSGIWPLTRSYLLDLCIVATASLHEYTPNDFQMALRFAFIAGISFQSVHS